MSASYPNEPGGTTLINDWGHNAIVGGGWTDVYNTTGYNTTTATNAQPGQIYVITGANANSTITDNATFGLSGDWTSGSDATLVLKCLDSTPRFIELARNTV